MSPLSCVNDCPQITWRFVQIEESQVHHLYATALAPVNPSQIHNIQKSIFLLIGGFLPQNFGKVVGPMNSILSFYECRLSNGNRGGGDTQTLHAVLQFI